MQWMCAAHGHTLGAREGAWGPFPFVSAPFTAAVGAFPSRSQFSSAASALGLSRL